MHRPPVTWFFLLISACCAALCAASLLCGVLCFLLVQRPLQLHHLDVSQQETPSVVLDCHGTPITTFAKDRRTPISYRQCAQTLIDAFIAAEDHQFFTHHGVSLRGILRSLLANLRKGRIVQGGSTITQQLARLTFLSSERRWSRKLHELLITLQLERQLSKQQILELYLNSVYFGRGIYGVQAACQRFWNIEVNQVTPAQAATLAAVANSARLFSPLNAPENALKRRDLVLRRMRNLGFVTHEQFTDACAQPLGLQEKPSTNPIRQYLCEHLRTWAEQQFGKDELYSQGLVIKTSIDVPAQEQLESAFKDLVSHLRTKSKQPIDGGSVCLDVTTGGVRALVGGYDFTQSQFNRALHAYRQIGSSFKPVLYAQAITQGWSLTDILVDEPLNIPQHNGPAWQPRNWDHQFRGPLPLARALTTSSNIVAIKLLEALGVNHLNDWAQKFGFSKPCKPYLSAALGTLEASVLENAAAFNVFANNGHYVEPWLVDSVRNRYGKVVWQREAINKMVLDPRVNSIMVNALSHRMRLAKPSSKEVWPQAETIGKTGSTNGAVSLWFVGSTPSYTTAVYLGRDDGVPLGNRLFAGQTAFPLWVVFMSSLQHPAATFFKSPAVVTQWINWMDGSPCRQEDAGAACIYKMPA